MIRIKNLLDLGVSESLDLVESNKQRVFNLFILLALPAIPIVLLYNLWKGNYGMVLTNSLQMILFLFAFWISYTRKLLFLRTLLLFLLSCIIFISALLFKTGIEYRLLLLMVVGVILIDKNWKFLVFAFLIAFEFTICKYYELRSLAIPLHNISIRILQIFFPFVITGISLFYLKYIYLKSQFKLQKALNEVSESNLLREKLMYSLAHDLRSPLNNVSGLVHLLKKHQQYSNEELKWLEMIEYSATNSNALVNELLESNDLMKSKLELHLTDLNLLLENVVVASRIKASEKNIQIEFQKTPSTYSSMVDPLKINRLLSNLINNAIKFSYPSGLIQVHISNKQEHIFIAIKDNGIGISEKNIHKIFDPFTKAKRKGTKNEASFGLGLSICKQIAELHHGSISVQSEMGKGSEFIVQLPISG